MSWFLTPTPRPRAARKLFCLPYAGAGASAFRAWPAACGPDLEVLALQLPGRENRITEPPVIDPAAIASAVADHADRPFALFGHSMGGRLGYEIVRELQATGGPLPTVLVVSGSRPPDVLGTGDLDGLSALDDDALVARLLTSGNLPAELAEHPEMRELVLPALRADFAWLDGYVYERTAPLPVPIVAVGGTQDRAVRFDELAGWERHTEVRFERHPLPGGHFFLHESLPELAALIRRTIRSAPARHALRFGTRTVWRAALLRTTGFPADELARFVFPPCAEAADAHLADPSEPTARERFDAALATATEQGGDEVRAIAADPRFREAITWQNPGALVSLDSLLRGPSAKGRSVQRRREYVTARYWQRYCAKNETIGFFGPTCWITLDDQAATTIRPGPRLLRDRRLFFEAWALKAFGEALAADPVIRPWLRPVTQPHVRVEQTTGQTPTGPAPTRQPRIGRDLLDTSTLSPMDRAALTACDGTRPAVEVVHGLGLRHEADGYLLLDRLVERGLLRWDLDLPLDPRAESVLVERLTAIPDPAARDEAESRWRRLATARDQVAAAAGDPDALLPALERLNSEFEAVTGTEATRRAGKVYAARGLVYEDTVRDLDVVIGWDVLAHLERPLEVILRATRWLCAELADAFTTALDELFDDLTGASPGGVVPLSELWFLAQGVFFGRETPTAQVTKVFQERWTALFDPRVTSGAEVPVAPEGCEIPGDAEIPTDSEAMAALEARAAGLFPEREPAWSRARIHSPDLQLCATDVEALRCGDFTAVLGEMHAAWATFDSASATELHRRPDDLAAALTADLGPHRVRLLYPPDWPRATGRLTQPLIGPTDIQLGFAAAPGADRTRLRPAAGLVVRRADDQTQRLVAVAEDGRSWPLPEIFADLLSVHAVDAFKVTGRRPHTPRVAIGKLVVTRETWCTTVAETGLAHARGERERFLAARRWRARLGLPEQVFVRVDTETKPVFVDFRAPLYVLSLCAFARAAYFQDADASITVTEMLPTAEQAWVLDGEGRRYFSELRIQVTDHA